MRSKAPNFLLPWQYKKLSFLSIVFLGMLTIFYILLLQTNSVLALILFGILFVLFLSLHLEWGIYVLAFVSFFHGWEIDFSTYTVAKTIPYLSGINAPFVDFFAIVLVLAALLSYVFYFSPIYWKSFQYIFPHWRIYGLFILGAFVSVSLMSGGQTGFGIKYFLRPMIFVYLMFVVLPCFIIERKHVLDKVLKIWFWVGSGIALFGLISLLRAVGVGGWFRVVPFGIYGFAPLGYNHNLLAEVLVAIIPIGGYLVSTAKKSARIVYIFLTAFMTLITLLTLSRAAWLALLLQAVIVFFVYRKNITSWLKRRVDVAYVLGVVLLISIVYMFGFLQSSVVTSSNQARIVSTQIATFYAMRAPLFGYGPGTFVGILAGTELYTLEFGDPLDAHGFVQKILVEEGIVGVFLFSLFLFYVLRNLWQAGNRKDDPILFQMLFLMVLGAVVFQLFNTSYFNANMWLPIGVSLSALQLYKFGENYAFRKT